MEASQDDPKTGMYWFRKVVPASMRQLVGRTEVRRTLRTKDPREAARRFTEVAATVAQEWEALRRGPAMVDLARRFVQQLDPDRAAALADDLLEVDLKAAGVLDERELPDDWEPPSTPARQKAMERVLERRGLASWIEEHIRAPLSSGQRARLVESVERVLVDPSPTPTPNPTSLTLRDILAGWRTEAQATGSKPATIKNYTRSMSRLIAFQGPAAPSPEDIIRFKDHRLATGSSARTVDTDLAGLKTVLGWAVTNRKLPVNPAAGIRIKVGKPARLRSKGLTEVEAGEILAASLRQTDQTKTALARRWVPWLAAYTGARVGELAQLRKQDVVREGDLWTIRLTPEAGTIKTNEARSVVLHSHLVELGFPAFAQDAPAGHLFLTPSATGDPLGPLLGVKNRLAEFVRGIVKDPNVAPMHGFRHRFKTVGMEAGIPPRILDAIQGHAARTASDGYGEVTVKTMAAAMERLPRIVL